MINKEEILKKLKNIAYNRAIMMENDTEAFAFSTTEKTGVIISYKNTEPIKLRFASSGLEDINITGEYEGRYLFFYCTDNNLIEKFANTCTDFLDKTKRNEIQEEPVKWWNDWKKLMGNVATEEMVYSTLGELIVFLWLHKNDNGASWGGPDASSHDIETTKESYEVKSTVKRYEREITISGEHQLEKSGKKPLFLAFLRLEKCTAGGFSIEKCVNNIMEKKTQKQITHKLEKMNLEPGTLHYKDEYTLTEACLYNVDDKFPKVTKEMLNKMIKGNAIRNFSYTIDLTGIDDKNITDNVNNFFHHYS